MWRRNCLLVEFHVPRRGDRTKLLTVSYGMKGLLFGYSLGRKVILGTTADKMARWVGSSELESESTERSVEWAVEWVTELEYCDNCLPTLTSETGYRLSWSLHLVSSRATAEAVSDHQEPRSESQRQPPAEVGDAPAQRVEKRLVEHYIRILRSWKKNRCAGRPSRWW